MNKIIAALVAMIAIAITAAPILAATSGSEGITASVTVEKICDLTVNPTGPIAFGSLIPETTSSPVQYRSAILDTNAPTNVGIYGTAWTGGSIPMPVGSTEYNKDDGLFTSLTDNSVNPPLLFSSNVDDTHSIGFQVTIPNNQPPAIYSQTITLSFSCDLPI